MHNKEDLLKWYDEEYCLEAVKQDGNMLRYVKNQTKDICLKAVKQDGLALQFVKTPTKEICLEALNRNIDAIQYVDIQKFPEIYEKYVFMIR